jgi:serine protease AprX
MVDHPTPGKALSRRELDRWLLGSGHGQRRTQDSPIMPDVWYSYGLPPSMLEEEVDEPPLVPPSGAGAARQRREQPPKEADLLLRPHAESTAGALAHVLSRRLTRPREETLLAFNEAYVVCSLTFEELLQAVLPLTEFWLRLWPGKAGLLMKLVRPRIEDIARHYEGGQRVQGRKSVQKDDLPGDLVWLLGLVGRIAVARGRSRAAPTARGVVEAALKAFGDVTLGRQEDPPLLWAASRNRIVRTSVFRSRITCKADAATRLFQLSCRDVRWAVIDSGVDARHPAFATRLGEADLVSDEASGGPVVPGVKVQPWNGLDAVQSAQSRVIQTWDFAELREILAQLPLDDAPATPASSLDDPVRERIRRTAESVGRGRLVDWDEIAPQLEIRHDAGYTAPRDDHGTHVAGILVADWRSGDRPSPGPHDVKGVCPDMRIYDLRAFNAAGESDEFQVLSAMQFVRHLNAHADLPVIHGVNLSFSVRHDVDKYAAGSTPVCDEAHRLVASGVVVVAAAGNDGRGGYAVSGRTVDGYRTVSITDPGNAEKVITVGATHRDRPHEYGVSYFSSRGPTGDGRPKPDLVAPGEKITAPVPDLGLKSKDGTSQAAPHVSGACALLMARHPELMGHPDRVKQVLIDSCTDLGRDRSFQGAGLVDILRAIQAV